MKKLFLWLLLCGNGWALSAQQPLYRHSISLDFSRVGTDMRKAFRPLQPALLLVPGLEYRVYLQDRLAARLGLAFVPAQNWELKHTGPNIESCLTAREMALHIGLQYDLWDEHYLPSFGLYLLAEAGAGQYRGDDRTFDRFSLETREMHLQSRSLSGAVGFGFAYFPAERWVLTMETMVVGSIFSGSMRREIYEDVPPHLIQASETPASGTNRQWIPLGQLSVGWRF